MVVNKEEEIDDIEIAMLNLKLPTHIKDRVTDYYDQK